MSTQIKSLQEAVNTQPGSYISGGFQAVVSNAKTVPKKAGGQFYKATLTEGALSVEATSFTTDFAPHQGKLIKFVGMGLKRGDDYNGKPQISIGDKARWIPAGDAPAQVTTQVNAQQSAPAPTHAQGVIPGITVGMAINAAINILTKQGDANVENIYQLASEIIRLSDKLQKGELAPVQGYETYQNPADEDRPF